MEPVDVVELEAGCKHVIEMNGEDPAERDVCRLVLWERAEGIRNHTVGVFEAHDRDDGVGDDVQDEVPARQLIERSQLTRAVGAGGDAPGGRMPYRQC